MSCYTWTIPSGASAAPTVQGNTSTEAALRLLFGRDIWLNVADEKQVDRLVTAARDWRIVDGEEAVRQSLLRRLMTAPGEWKTKPNYGVGARAYLKKPGTARTTEELAGRIVAQFRFDKRVEQVTAVTADWRTNLLIISVAAKLRGRDLRNDPFIVSAQAR